jgi:NitT/TauT family transport system substrate-binding protein
MIYYKQTRSRWQRRSIAVTFGVVLMNACGVGFDLPPAPKAETPRESAVILSVVRLALQWQPQSQFAGFYMARDKGLFRAAGLDVRLIHGNSDYSSLDRLRDGSADIATLFLADAIIAAAPRPPANPPQTGIVQLAQLVQRSNLMLVAWKDMGVTRARDLAGTRVSYWQGSFSSAFKAFFAANGVDPEPIPQYATVNLFLKRGVAACAAMEYNEYHRIWQSGIDDDRITAFRMRDYGLGFPEDGLYATATWVNQNPELARAVRSATLAGWDYARSHPEEAIDTVLAEAGLAGVPANRPQERWMLNHMIDSIFVPGAAPEELATLDRAEFNKAAQAMQSAGLLNRAPVFGEFAPFARSAP